MRNAKKVNKILPIDVVVFSRERQQKLSHSLKLWSQQPFRFIILDNSVNPLKFEFEKNINYFHLPGLNFGSRANEAIQHLNNSYSIICADDECFIPISIISMIDFLEKNDNFASVGGRVVAIYKYGPRLVGIPAYDYMSSYVNENEDLDIRLKNHFTLNLNGHIPIGAMFRLYREEGMKKLLKSFFLAENIETPYVFQIIGEIVGTSLGPTRNLKSIYWIRNWNNEISNHADWNRSKTFSSWWIDAKNQEAKIKFMITICENYGLNQGLLSELLDFLVKQLLPIDNAVKQIEIVSIKHTTVRRIIHLLKFVVKRLVRPKSIPKSLKKTLNEDTQDIYLEEKIEVIYYAKELIGK